MTLRAALAILANGGLLVGYPEAACAGDIIIDLAKHGDVTAVLDQAFVGDMLKAFVREGDDRDMFTLDMLVHAIAVWMRDHGLHPSRISTPDTWEALRDEALRSSSLVFAGDVETLFG